MRLYKFLKPSQSVALVGDEIAFANKCNLLGAKSWKSNAKELHTFIRGDIKKRTNLKEKIKKALKIYQENHCYYCGIYFPFLRNDLTNVHIDHFYPKGAEHGHYGKYVFEMRNLVLSCSICNGLGVKGENDYGIHVDELLSRIGTTIIHPYFDDINEHFLLNEKTGVLEFINIDKSKAVKTAQVFGLNEPEQIRARLGDILAEANMAITEEKELVLDVISSVGIYGRVAGK